MIWVKFSWSFLLKRYDSIERLLPLVQDKQIKLLGWELWDEKEKNIYKQLEYLLEDGFYRPCSFTKNKKSSKKNSYPLELKTWIAFSQEASFGILKVQYHPKMAIPYAILYSYFLKDLETCFAEQTLSLMIKRLFDTLNDLCFIQIITNHPQILSSKLLQQRDIFRIKDEFFYSLKGDAFPILKQQMFTITRERLF